MPRRFKERHYSLPIIIGFIIMLFLLATMAIAGVSGVKQIANSNVIALDRRREMADIRTMQLLIKTMDNSQTNYIYNGDPVDAQAFKNSITALLEYRSKISKTIETEDDRLNLNIINSQTDQYIKLFSEQIIPARENADTESLKALKAESNELISQIDPFIQNMIANYEKKAQDAYLNALDAKNKTITISIILSILLSLLGVATGIVISITIARNTQQIVLASEQLKLSEAALKESERFLNKIIENIPNMVFVKEAPDLRYIIFNHTGEEILGLNPGSLKGKTDFDIFPKEMAELYRKNDLEVLDYKQLLDIPEEPVQAKNNETRIFHTKKIPILDEEGNPNFLLGISEDITDRIRAEQALLESESTVRNKLKAIIEPEGDIGTLELSDIIETETLQSMMEDFYQVTGILGAILDISGKVLVSVGWQNICTKFHRCHPDSLKNCLESDTILANGVPEGSFKGYKCKNNMWDMVTPIMVGGRHVGNSFIGQFFYDDEIIDYDLFRKQAQRYGFDETEYIEALKRVPRLSRDTVNAGMQFYAKLARIISKLSFSTIQLSRNIAERKLAEEEIRKLNDELELRVLDRTKQLVSANNELESFSYSISHDLRAPLRAINGYSQIIKEEYFEGLSPVAINYFDLIRKNAIIMGQLVDDLLNFSRLGRQAFIKTKLDPVPMINSIIESIKPEGEKRNITFSVDKLPPCEADPVFLKQVYVNLISNALKFSKDKKESLIEIGFQYSPKNTELKHKTGKPIIYFVRDNGIGFDMKYYNKLFGVFQRLHTADSYEGTGVGLAIVSRIVTKHGGKIWAESTLGQGATFYFTLEE